MGGITKIQSLESYYDQKVYHLFFNEFVMLDTLVNSLGNFLSHSGSYLYHNIGWYIFGGVIFLVRYLQSWSERKRN